jgi:anti-anti-sigma factor
MQIKIEEINNAARMLVLNGRFNMYAVPVFQALVDDHVPRDMDVLLHLAEVPHIDSSALGTIIRLQLSLEEKGHRLLLVEPMEAVLEIFRMTGTANRFQFFASKDEALQQV